jgi:cytochrome c-type biogenesis protein
MTKVEPDIGSAPAPSSERHRLEKVARGLAWTIGIAGAIAGLFFLVVWLLPASEIDGALLGPVGIVVAFLVGVISFFSPCILPLLPGYLSFVSGLSGEELEAQGARKRVLAGTSLFVLGFAFVFTALGAAASAVGGFFLDNLSVFNRVAGVLVIAVGIAFLVPGLSFLERERRPLMRNVKPGVAGAFPLGLAFAVGWTPCVGPGLGAILSLGLVEATVWRGALLTFFFSLGFGMWFVLAGLGAQRAFKTSSWLKRNTRPLQAVGGVFMIAIGVLLVTNRWEELLSPLRRLINSFAPPV